jgi:Zn-dependent peptidase ImmA (M78 family)/transcriptional regulator with XRE-family HTH domain
MKQARLASGLTLDDLSQKLTVAGHPITKAALSKYELSKSTPKPAILIAIARILSVRPSYFSEERAVQVTWIGFRKRSKMPVKMQEQVRAFASQVVENQLWLQQLLYPQLKPSLPKPRRASTLDDAEDAAANLRKAWNLGDAPIDSLTAIVENNGGVVIPCANISTDFDGLAGMTESGFPVAVVSMQVPDDRRRNILAHEVGHIVMECGGATSKLVEALCNRFASALLVPPSIARQELGSKRRRLDLRELGFLKQKYGLSIQAWVRRARDLNIIEEPQYRSLCIAISGKEWRRAEPVAFQGNETPSRLWQMTVRALSEGVISAHRAEQIIPGCTQKMAMPAPERLSAAEIRKLPREQRDAILSAAAQMAEAEYATNRDLTSFEAYGEDDLYDGYAKSR